MVKTQGPLYARAIHRLQALCHEADQLPSSCIVASEVVLEQSEPFSKSAFSDVSSGRISNLRVALKALRVHKDSKAKVQKVRVVVVTRCCRYLQCLARRSTRRRSCGNPFDTPTLSGSLVFPEQ